MQEIHAWLHNGRDFESGADLYRKYGSNSFLKLLLSDGPTPFNEEQLLAELEALASAHPAAVDQESAVSSNITEKPKKADSDQPIKSNPDDHSRYLNLKEAQKNLYRQLDRNMMELDRGTKQSFLHLTSNNILSLHAKVMDIWRLLDYYDAKGKFPDLKPEIIRTSEEEIQALRVSISKANSRLKSSGCRDRAQTEQLIITNKKRILELGGKVKL